MLENIYIVTDLGPGDGGKGSVVHALAHKVDATVIIKRGGAQGSHGVRTYSGDSFNFSQWGCGTLDGIPTYCSEQMVISPVGLENESDALSHLGIYDPYVLLSVAPTCLCTTPFHRISSQLEELILGYKPRGTVGTGVGRAYRMYNEFGNDMSIVASELTDRNLVRMKLKRQLDYYRERYAKLSVDNGIPEDADLIEKNLELLHDDGFVPYTVDLFERVGKKLRIRELSEVLHEDGCAIVECSHGVLTDAETGLKPHVSAIRTLPKFTCKMLRNTGYRNRITNLAVHRAYEIRHGAGPIPTYDPEFTNSMLPGSHKDENRWQGIVRAGPLDLNLMRYALSASIETPFDGLCLTWFDQILKTGRIWTICPDYKNISREYRISTEFLKRADPLLRSYQFRDPISKADFFNAVENVIHDHIGLPLSMISVGPTEMDKIISKNI